MLYYLQNLFSDLGLNDVIDIVIVTFVLYKVLGFIKESRAEQLVKGLLVIAVAFFGSEIFQLHTLNWIIKGGMTVGIVALVVVFQPELRRGLEYMGRSKILKNKFLIINTEEAKAMIHELVVAMEEFSSSRTGALIIIERETALIDICETGTKIDAKITKELIGNIFYEGSPLHDGALIVRGRRLDSAGCVLPLTENMNISKSLGTRHRAGIGITEKSDCYAFIVSEETGVISLAKDGTLERNLTGKDIEKHLMQIYVSNSDRGLLDGIKPSAQKSNESDDKKEKGVDDVSK